MQNTVLGPEVKKKKKKKKKEKCVCVFLTNKIKGIFPDSTSCYGCIVVIGCVVGLHKRLLWAYHYWENLTNTADNAVISTGLSSSCMRVLRIVQQGVFTVGQMYF